jgi:hypothetical protein
LRQLIQRIHFQQRWKCDHGRGFQCGRADRDGRKLGDRWQDLRWWKLSRKPNHWWKLGVRRKDLRWWDHKLGRKLGHRRKHGDRRQLDDRWSDLLWWRLRRKRNDRRNH